MNMQIDHYIFRNLQISILWKKNVPIILFVFMLYTDYIIEIFMFVYFIKI